jgi:type IV secretion system protein VirB9
VIRRYPVLAAALLIIPTISSAQMMPWSGGGDTRIQSIEYRNSQVVRIRAAPGYQVTIELAPDERIESIALGDSGAWQVTANKAANLLFVKPIQADVTTNMTVVTDVRTYNFDLTGVAEVSGDLPYAIRFTYPALTASGPPGMPGMPPMPGMSGGPQAASVVGTYRLRGHKSLRPDAISDDGTRTFIDWPADGPLPAVYSRDRDGRETLLNGNVRGGLFVIDGINEHLVFRVDKHRAGADRLEVVEKK